MNKATDSKVDCKRIAKLVADGGDELSTTPSSVWQQAQISSILGCKALNVSKNIEKIIEAKNDGVKDLSDQELYYAYLLNQNASEYGLSGNSLGKPLQEILVSKANIEWLPNFNADKWTLKKVIRSTDSKGDISERIETQHLNSSLL